MLAKKELNTKTNKTVLSNLSLLDSGTVLAIKDGIVTAKGLDSVAYGELVCFKQPNNEDIVGIVMTLTKKNLEIVVLKNDKDIQIKDKIYRFDDNGQVGRFPRVRVGYELLGKHIDCLGNLQNKKDIAAKDLVAYNDTNVTYRNIFKKAPGIVEREPVKFPIYTGIQIVDAFFPIGCGQRELIIGDKFTGKTTFAVTSILNQKETNKDLIRNVNSNLRHFVRKEHVLCIYAAVGQRRSSVLRIYNLLKKEHAIEYTCIVSSTSSCSAIMQYLTPYVGCTVGEYFMETGSNAIIVYDDLTNHAIAYRQMSLLLRRPPGREAYPGDVFYVHSSLLERAAQMNRRFGGGSLTAFPIIETQCGDVSSYIPTNVISITDGQIFLDTVLFNKGIRPAVHAGLSVSRVGSAAQNKSIRLVSRKMKIAFAEFSKVEGIGTMGDVDPSVVAIISTGLRLREIFKQRKPRSFLEQLIIGYTISAGFVDKVYPTNTQLYYKLLFDSEYSKKLVNQLNFAHKANYYTAHYFMYDSEASQFLNYFLQFYPIDKLKDVLDLDAILASYSRVFVTEVQPRLEKILKKKI